MTGQEIQTWTSGYPNKSVVLIECNQLYPSRGLLGQKSKWDDIKTFWYTSMCNDQFSTVQRKLKRAKPKIIYTGHGIENQISQVGNRRIWQSVRYPTWTGSKSGRRTSIWNIICKNPTCIRKHLRKMRPKPKSVKYHNTIHILQWSLKVIRYNKISTNRSVPFMSTA